MDSPKESLKKACETIRMLKTKLNDPHEYLIKYFSSIVHHLNKRRQLNEYEIKKLEDLKMSFMRDLVSRNFRSDLKFLDLLKSQFYAWYKLHKSATITDIELRKLNDKLNELEIFKKTCFDKLFGGDYRKITSFISKFKKNIVNRSEVSDNDDGNEKKEEDEVIYLKTTYSKEKRTLPTPQTLKVFEESKKLSEEMRKRYPDLFDTYLPE